MMPTQRRSIAEGTVGGLCPSPLTGFGWLAPQLPWRDIGWIWVYNLVWMVGLDLGKLGSNRLLEHRAGLKQRFLLRLNQPIHRPEMRR
jgi:H+-transporting ATPase